MTQASPGMHHDGKIGARAVTSGSCQCVPQLDENQQLALLLPGLRDELLDGRCGCLRDTDVRAALGPLKDLAEEMRVAIITVMHFNKKTDITNALLPVKQARPVEPCGGSR
jgi:hypothetical protein